MSNTTCQVCDGSIPSILGKTPYDLVRKALAKNGFCSAECMLQNKEADAANSADNCYYCGAEFDDDAGGFLCDCADNEIEEAQRCGYCGDEVQGHDHSECETGDEDGD